MDVQRCNAPPMSFDLGDRLSKFRQTTLKRVDSLKQATGKTLDSLKHATGKTLGNLTKFASASPVRGAAAARAPLKQSPLVRVLLRYYDALGDSHLSDSRLFKCTRKSYCAFGPCIEEYREVPLDSIDSVINADYEPFCYEKKGRFLIVHCRDKLRADHNRHNFSRDTL